MEIKVKPFEDQYAAQVAALMEDFHNYLVSIDDGERLRTLPGYGEHQLKTELKAVEDKNGYFPLALDGEKVIGFGVALILPEQTPEMLLGTKPAKRGRIEELYVSSEYRGKGVASMIMKSLEEYLKNQGCEYVYLGVFAFNKNAHEMYQHMGYGDKGIEMMKELKN